MNRSEHDTFVGALILGWGLFNLVEGIIDHHILHVHHVTETEHHLIWDLAFLASGVVMIVVGCLVIGRKTHQSPPPPQSSP